MNESKDEVLLDFARALEGAVAVVRHLSETDALDEETLTGTVLGALCSGMGYQADLADSKHEHLKGRFSWARYNKGTAKNHHSEARNGADFALVFVDAVGQSRIAIFQAKKGKVSRPHTEAERWSLETFHRTKDVSGTPLPQMEPLARSARAIMKASSTRRKLDFNDINEFYKLDPPTVDGLTWIHYVAYVNGTPLCFPLSDMEDLLTASRAIGAKTAKLTFSLQDDPTTLFDVLDDGLNGKPRHWLPIKNIDALKILPKLIDLMPVYFAGHLQKLDMDLEATFPSPPSPNQVSTSNGARRSFGAKISGVARHTRHLHSKRRMV